MKKWTIVFLWWFWVAMGSGLEPWSYIPIGPFQRRSDCEDVRAWTAQKNQNATGYRYVDAWCDWVGRDPEGR